MRTVVLNRGRAGTMPLSARLHRVGQRHGEPLLDVDGHNPRHVGPIRFVRPLRKDTRA